jgi:dolichol-phosphate mannosyltransferase
MKLSFVVPFHNEAPSVLGVLAEIRRHHPHDEIIAVDDCSSDETFALIGTQADVRAHRLSRHLGQSAAVYAGLRLASGDVCVILDGDGQSSVADVKALIAHLPEYDFVCGYRAQRSDTAHRILASRIANLVRRIFTGDDMRDAGCTPKVMKRECVDHLVPFDGMHRFLPALLCAAGMRGIEVPVSHHARMHGRTHYTSSGRALRGVVDLVGVRWWMSRRLDLDALGLDAASETGDTRPFSPPDA